MDVLALFNVLPDPWRQVVLGLLLIFGIFSVIARFTPSKSDDMAVDWIWGLIQTIALNPPRHKARPGRDIVDRITGKDTDC